MRNEGGIRVREEGNVASLSRSVENSPVMIIAVTKGLS
jgi:hypothetical protein